MTLAKHNTDCPFYPVPEHGSSITQKALSAGTYREGCSSQGHNKRDICVIIYNTTVIRGPRIELLWEVRFSFP